MTSKHTHLAPASGESGNVCDQNTSRQRDLDRFWFGKNWTSFLGLLTAERVHAAEQSLATMLGRERLEGLTMLDAGSGSGLFSLAALHLGAQRVVSFDYDEDSVACARVLDRRYGSFPNWSIAQGSVLDRAWLEHLGYFDIVYCWGVLHHTGNMWEAMENIAANVKAGGQLYIALYNNQGWISTFWTRVKRIYIKSPAWLRFLLVMVYYAIGSVWRVLRGLWRREPMRTWFGGARHRGMSLYYDIVDWLGGYPFETARPEQVIDFYQRHGFALVRTVLTRGSGCNEFVFQRAIVSDIDHP